MKELIRITEGLLSELTSLLHEWKSSLQDMSHDFPDWFVYVHARNIHELVSAILILQQGAQTGPTRILLRICLESYFNLAAALNVPGFPKSKVHAELRNQKNRICQLRTEGFGDENACDELESGTDAMIQLFSSNVGPAIDNSSWDTYAVANQTKSKPYYRTAYFTYSQHVHANFAVLINDEGKNEAAILSSIQVVSSLVALVAGLVVNYRKPPDVLQRRERIALLSIELAKFTGWTP